MSHTHAAASTLLTCILMSGCASFKANHLPDVSGDVDRVTTSEKTNVFSRWESDSSRSTSAKAAFAAIHKSDFEKAIRDTGCCDIVESLSEADVVVDGTAVDHSNPAVLVPAVITGVSLYTIPSWATEKVDLKVTAETDGRVEDYELYDSVTMVQWLPMLFVFPFTGNPLTNAEEVRANTHRNLISRLMEDDML